MRANFVHHMLCLLVHPQTWHWNEKRFIAQYYADLAKKESRIEAERQTVIKAKFAELERELLA